MVDGVLLAVEAATRATSVALVRDGELLGELAGPAEQDVAESLLGIVDALLGDVGCRADEIDGFAVSIGPGSFTSLRIGIATVKGLAFGRAHRAVGVPTLEALALGTQGAGSVVPLLDARRGEFYAAAYASGEPGADGRLEVRLEAGVYRPEEIADALSGPIVLVGEGVPLCGDAIRAAHDAPVDLVTPPAGLPSASRVARLGASMLESGLAVHAADLVPEYLRRAEAEVKRTGVRFERGKHAPR